ncbi:hypothetical protein B0O99DRAFT_599650 [Bisporella sp. PMI_857]|nr:hypothetical protein B0O99DRAFT_599650 [Bisporella sp. PMI_857]
MRLHPLLSLVPLTTAFPFPFSLLSFTHLQPRQCAPSTYCILVCNSPHFAGSCHEVCGPNGECRLIQSSTTNTVFSARTTCGPGVFLYDYKVCYNNATRLWVDQTGVEDMTGLRNYYGVNSK